LSEQLKRIALAHTCTKPVATAFEGIARSKKVLPTTTLVGVGRTELAETADD
jgi:hypothetical protein